MKRIMALGLMVCVTAALGRAGEVAAVPRALVPASIFEARDLPDVEPGKPAWRGNAKFAGICVFGKWVYAVSPAGYVLQFERDPATAKMVYKGASPLGFAPDADSIVNHAFARVPPGGDALAYFEFGDHNPHQLAWYALDRKTGAPAFKGRQAPVAGHVWWCYQYVPASDRIYGMIGREAKAPLATRRFDESGATVEDGRVETLGTTLFGWLVASPDGRHVYIENGRNVDAYACDVKTGKMNYVASVDAGDGHAYLSPVSPDGRHVYLFGERNRILVRDPEKGTLTVATNSVADAAFRGQAGAPWSQHSRFAFCADGKSGAFLTTRGVVGLFTRDPESGALTVTATAAAGPVGAAHLALDPKTGHLFTVGEKIASFKPY